MTRTFTVPILLPADPTVALEAATKQYVDAVGAGGIGTVNSFNFSTSTSAPPASAGVRFNNSTQASTTVIWVHQLTFDGLDISIGLARLTADYQLYIQDFDNSALWLLFDVTGSATDLGTYWSVPVTYNSGPGGLANNQKIAMQTITPANHGVPGGGADGDVLTKTSSSDFAVAWEAPTPGGGVPTSRTISTFSPITIDGGSSADLSANRVLAIADESIENVSLVPVPNLTIKGNFSGGDASPQDLEADEVRTILAYTEYATFSVPGTVATATGGMRFYFDQAATFTQVRASVGTAPTGASLIVDVNKNGTTIFTTQSNRPTIAVSTNTDLSGTPDVLDMAIGDYITVDVDQVGSTVAGSNLTVQVEYRVT